MSIRKVTLAVSEFYHIYNRGNSRQIIFKDSEDYDRFVALLYVCNGSNRFHFHNNNGSEGFSELLSFDRGETLVAIGAYVLMPNHFHLLLTPLSENGASVFMQKLSTAYVMYFNRKYKRVGSLFEGKFRSIHIDTDKYLKYLFSYIHLNPLKIQDASWKSFNKLDKQSFEYIENYSYSSYINYVDDSKPEEKILSKSHFPKYFNTIKDFRRELWFWFKENINK